MQHSEAAVAPAAAMVTADVGNKAMRVWRRRLGLRYWQRW